MFGFTGFQEIALIMLVIAVFSMTGLWPQVIRGIRELRGDPLPDLDPTDLDMCYRMLGLTSSASWDEVEKAYRAKAKIHHPDHGGDEDTMRALNEAYARLKQVKKR